MSETIPEWALKEARALIENYGFDQDVLLGAIAAALLARDERAAKILHTAYVNIGRSQHDHKIIAEDMILTAITHPKFR